MYSAKTFTVCIPSSGVALEEEHIAREVIARWNIEEGEKHGVVFLTIPNNYKGITPDICIFAIDNYVDESKVEVAIRTGAKIFIFFRSHHDYKNTIGSEIQSIEDFRKRIEPRCLCVDYKSMLDLETLLCEALNKETNNLNDICTRM